MSIFLHLLLYFLDFSRFFRIFLKIAKSSHFFGVWRNFATRFFCRPRRVKSSHFGENSPLLETLVTLLQFPSIILVIDVEQKQFTQSTRGRFGHAVFWHFFVRNHESFFDQPAGAFKALFSSLPNYFSLFPHVFKRLSK